MVDPLRRFSITGIGTIRASNKRRPAVLPPAISANVSLTPPFRSHVCVFRASSAEENPLNLTSQASTLVSDTLVRKSGLTTGSSMIVYHCRCMYFHREVTESVHTSSRVCSFPRRRQFFVSQDLRGELSQGYFSEFCCHWHAKFRRPLLPFNRSPTTAYTRRQCFTHRRPHLTICFS